MKKFNKIFFSLAMGAALMGSTTSCSDFEEINLSPSAAGEQYIHPDYPLNKSFYEAQQDPHIAERIVCYQWASSTRVIGDNTVGATARYFDDHNECLYSYTANWIKFATNAIELADKNEGSNQHEKEFFPNVKQIARIWRAMLIADFTDSFGPYPLNAAQGVNPTFNSVEEVYAYLLTELKEAAAAINTSVEPTADEAKGDPAFGYNGAKWVKLAHSLRLRYSMRLSEVSTSLIDAKAEFADAASKSLLTGADDVFSFPEAGGWSCYEGVYNRSYSDHCISSTMCNLLAGLGNISVTDYRPDLAPYIKPMNYVGEKYVNHFPECTDNPTKQLWMDGIPEYLDPRALVVWCLTNDKDAVNFPDQASQGVNNHAKRVMLDPATEGKDTLVVIDAQFTWNGYPAGVRSAWSTKTFKYNNVMAAMYDTTPMLGKQFRDNTGRRIWMSPWETYFLLAEGALRGWTTATTAKAAYESGVRANFEFLGIGQYANQYLASTNYNRVGTSVNFDHVEEPTSFEADYVDGYTKVAGKMTYNYPDASKILYKGGKLNDQLTKIITQKYIANTPYGVVEMWNARRRLGLPFFEIAGNEGTLTGSDKEKYYTPEDWKNGQKWSHYTQRLRYPSALENSDKEQYQNALNLLGGENTMMVPLWWAIK